ncbi:MAG: hypothetical protein ABF613_05230, partial [Bifidobacterium aquikefiri]
MKDNTKQTGSVEQPGQTASDTSEAGSGTKVREREVTMPHRDPNNPYAFPALMPSSADKAIRSFSPDAFSIPTKAQADWRFTPLDRIDAYFP